MRFCGKSAKWVPGKARTGRCHPPHRPLVLPGRMIAYRGGTEAAALGTGSGCPVPAMCRRSPTMNPSPCWREAPPPKPIWTPARALLDGDTYAQIAADGPRTFTLVNVLKEVTGWMRTGTSLFRQSLGRSHSQSLDRDTRHRLMERLARMDEHLILS